jgi:hypothetical protein
VALSLPCSGVRLTGSGGGQALLHRMLFARFFFKLFLHWHTGVRQAFHRLLLCKARSPAAVGLRD